MDNNAQGTICSSNKPNGVQFIADRYFVHISISRYEELVKAEAELDVLFRAYQQFDGYLLHKIMAAVFGPDSEENDLNAQ